MFKELMFCLVEGTKTNVFLDEHEHFIFWVFFNSVDNKNTLLLALLMSQAYTQEKEKTDLWLHSVALLKPMEKLLLTRKKESREERIL